MMVEKRNTARPAGGGPADASRAMEPIEHEAADLTRTDRMIDEWGRQSFPASDPPPTW